MTEPVANEEILQPHEKLRRYIDTKHIKQAGLARELGISPSNFNMKLTGDTHKFTPEQFLKLEEFLGIKIEDL